jgi:hypothetical protein
MIHRNANREFRNQQQPTRNSQFLKVLVSAGRYVEWSSLMNVPQISHVASLVRAADAANHDEERQQERRRPPRKPRTAATSVYTPEGKLDEQAGSSLDVLA